MDREYEPTLDDERPVPLDADDEEPFAPPTLDPEERVEEDPDEDDDSLPDEERPV